VTLMIFIYVYYRLFAYTNLVDIISLFFTIFSLTDFMKNSADISQKKSAHRFLIKVG
jgi:hypothetical protein